MGGEDKRIWDLMGKPEGKGTLGKSGPRWQNSANKDVSDIVWGYVNWNGLV
jgi:hypothetical protein